MSEDTTFVRSERATVNGIRWTMPRTACDKTAALSQSAYVLFYAWESGWEGGAGGGSAALLWADPTEPGQPVGDANGRASGSEESPENTEVEGMSLQQCKRLQEHNRPKPALDLEDPVWPPCRRTHDLPAQTRRREKPHAAPTRARAA